MKTWLFLSLILSWPLHALVILPGPNVSETEYRAYLKVHPDDTSPALKILGERPTKERREHLIRLLALAQEAYLNQNHELAIEKFKEISDLRPLDDWMPEDRSIFLYTYLRLYQLEPSASSWLTMAVSIGSDLLPDGEIFPPPLIAKFNSERAKIHYLTVGSQIFEDWPTILINGQPCGIESCSKIPDIGNNRITFVSDRWQLFTRYLTARDLVDYKPPKEPWITGDCRRTRLSSNARNMGETKEFWGLECEAPTMVVPDLPKESTLPRSQLLKSKWLWAGLSVMLGGLYIKYQLDHQQKEPTTTYGY